MIRKLPVIPTIVVVAAAAIMVALGFWQLQRADEKAALLARYAEASGNTQPVAFPYGGDDETRWFRNSAIDCREVLSMNPVAGSNERGAKGWIVRATCADPASDEPVIVDLGFSRDLPQVDWQGGEVTGAVGPGPRLVAIPPVAGLDPQGRPNPADLPNNHLAYAGQWFFFALTALVIFGIAVRSKLARRD